MKAHLNVSVENEFVEKAKENRWNISQIAEDAIRDKINAPKVEEVLVCEFCNEKGERETAEEVIECEKKAKSEQKEGQALSYSNPTSLTWLDNYQQWICNKCLKTAISKINLQ